MLLDRVKLEEKLQRIFWNISIDTQFQMNMYSYAKDKYNMSEELFSDYVSSRKSLQEATEFMLFVMLESYEYEKKVKTSKIPTFFSKKEIETYGFSKFEEPKFQFPIIFEMIQIADDQWIGKIDVKTFDKLREQQLINYNPDTQRTMQRVIRKGNINYKIMVNKKAVSEIAESFGDKTYIPDELTLNIRPDDENADFYYDDKKHLLVINNITSFDINDGYHRYLGMFRAKMLNPDFEYTMELRITNFDTDKSQRFIYQKDQKTQMAKVDSQSYNTYDAANIVVRKINESASCNIRGYIGRNDANIDMGSLSQIIRMLYFKNVPKKDERKAVIEVTKNLINDFNILTEEEISFLDKRYSFNELVYIVTTFHYFDANEKDKNNIVAAVKYLIKNVAAETNLKNKVSIKMLNHMEEILQEGEESNYV